MYLTCIVPYQGGIFKMAAILIVDDLRSVRQVVKATVIKCFTNHTVSEAATADEAIKLAAKGKYDLLIVDWSATDNGQSRNLTSRLVRQQPELKVLVISDDIDLTERAAVLGYGALDKPLKIDSLAAQISASLA